ncbi:MAG TPA: zf-HC2 domain-containing protein [Candidatus Acidoferrales bacterium]|nr:zf-HC2 domain-containing protein [Candidatus Acidoferrales bacterium]
MNCKTIVTELTNYLDDALDPMLRQALEQHLGKCKDCRLVVDTTKQTIQIYCNSEPAPLPTDTRQRLHAALEKKLRRARA